MSFFHLPKLPRKTSESQKQSGIGMLFRFRKLFFSGTHFPIRKSHLMILIFFSLAYLIGWQAARLTAPVRMQAANASVTDNWGLSFPNPGQAPVGNASAEELAEYNAHYMDPSGEKVIYLTFDAGYENGNTPAILDALKKHNVTATFFLVGNYLSTSPDLVKRMLEEGHIVANHTYHHPDMSQISSQDAFAKELSDLETLYQETTGQTMPHYYRPPQGKYSESNLQMAKDLGYQTFFWSLAYMDWDEKDQPTREEAFDKLLTRIHPGAIVLLHSTSATNAAILDELLTEWENMGYTFGSLDDLVKPNNS